VRENKPLYRKATECCTLVYIHPDLQKESFGTASFLKLDPRL